MVYKYCRFVVKIWGKKVIELVPHFLIWVSPCKNSLDFRQELCTVSSDGSNAICWSSSSTPIPPSSPHHHHPPFWPNSTPRPGPLNSSFQWLPNSALTNPRMCSVLPEHPHPRFRSAMGWISECEARVMYPTSLNSLICDWFWQEDKLQLPAKKKIYIWI